MTDEADQAFADLASRRIEGFAVHGGQAFSVPLISHIDGNLWTGGCLDGLPLPDRFEFLVSLYPWESYQYDRRKIAVLSVPLLDAHELPDLRMLKAIAEWVFEATGQGPTLVHCQAGLNRSALVAGLVLIRDGLPPRDAISLLRTKRCPAVLCNRAFEHLLLRPATAELWA